MNYVKFLPECKKKNRTFKHILVIINRLTKKRLYESMTSLNIEKLIETMIKKIFSQYKFPLTYVNDKNIQLISNMGKKICDKYNIKIKAFTAFHSKTNEQTKNVNKVMKNYLKMFVNHAQNDGIDLLSKTEFVANNHVNASTNMTSFFADHDYESRIRTEFSKTYENKGNAELLTIDKLMKKHEIIKKYLKKQLTGMQNEQTHHANKTRQSHFEYKIGDKIYVNAKNLKLKRVSKSLSSKNVKSGKIIKIINNKTYELKISKHLKQAEMHFVFHSGKLHLVPNNPIFGQILPEGPSLVIEDENGKLHEEYDVLEVVDCRETKRFGLQYKATFMKNWDEGNANSPGQFGTDSLNAPDKILKYHEKNSTKPKPPKEFMKNGEFNRIYGNSQLIMKSE